MQCRGDLLPAPGSSKSHKQAQNQSQRRGRKRGSDQGLGRDSGRGLGAAATGSHVEKGVQAEGTARAQSRFNMCPGKSKSPELTKEGNVRSSGWKINSDQGRPGNARARMAERGAWSSSGKQLRVTEDLSGGCRQSLRKRSPPGLHKKKSSVSAEQLWH